jgi:hypothetical protein
MTKLTLCWLLLVFQNHGRDSLFWLVSSRQVTKTERKEKKKDSLLTHSLTANVKYFHAITAMTFTANTVTGFYLKNRITRRSLK